VDAVVPTADAIPAACSSATAPRPQQEKRPAKGPRLYILSKFQQDLTLMFFKFKI
jgi:hypothetical protein